jgi:hypothetical protein
MRSSGGRSDFIVSPETIRRQALSQGSSRQALSQELEFGRIDSGHNGEKLPQSAEKELHVLPTALKRNITSRRSKDRKVHLSERQPSDITSKRSMEREKDKQYKRMSGTSKNLDLPSRTVIKSPTSQLTPKPREHVQFF